MLRKIRIYIYYALWSFCDNVRLRPVFNFAQSMFIVHTSLIMQIIITDVEKIDINIICVWWDEAGMRFCARTAIMMRYKKMIDIFFSFNLDVCFAHFINLLMIIIDCME